MNLLDSQSDRHPPSLCGPWPAFPQQREGVHLRLMPICRCKSVHATGVCHPNPAATSSLGARTGCFLLSPSPLPCSRGTGGKGADATSLVQNPVKQGKRWWEPQMVLHVLPEPARGVLGASQEEILRGSKTLLTQA